MMNGKISNLYKKLKDKHGRPQSQWSLWCKRSKTLREKEEVIIGAILTQRTNWNNVNLAMANLKKEKLNSLRKIFLSKNKKRLALLIKPAGFYKQKGGYLIGLAQFIVSRYGSVAQMVKEPAEKLRKELLEIKGIGAETADSILLYALEKPVFVIDEYTRRLLKSKKKYEELREVFEKNLPRSWRLYQDFHALIVIDGKSKRN